MAVNICIFEFARVDGDYRTDCVVCYFNNK